MKIDGETFEQWAARLFEYEYCAECHGDVEHHEPWIFNGHWFAHCKQLLAAGLTVETQHGGTEHRGIVLDERHPLADDGWVWVQWEHIGRHDEAIEDLTIVGWPS